MYLRGLLALELCVAVLAPSSTLNAQDAHPPVLIVSGMSSRQVAADSAEVRVAWYLTSADAEAQEREDAADVEALRTLLAEAGASSVVIRFAPDPWYAPMHDDLPNRPRERRREVLTTIVGGEAIIDALAALRNHPIFLESSAEYGCTCADSARTNLLKAAFDQSRARATALAEAAGTRIQGVVAMSTAPLDMQMLRGYQSVPLDAGGLESYGIPLMPPQVNQSENLAAPLVTVTAVVNVAWQIGRPGPVRE